MGPKPAEAPTTCSGGFFRSQNQLPELRYLSLGFAPAFTSCRRRKNSCALSSSHEGLANCARSIGPASVRPLPTSSTERLEASEPPAEIPTATRTPSRDGAK
jgi:hypothetical protein